RFGLRPRVHWDPTERGGRWRVWIHSREFLRWLEGVGIDLSALARDKKIPDTILRSPKAVMSAFLRGYFDADAYAGPSGVILSSSQGTHPHGQHRPPQPRPLLAAPPDEGRLYPTSRQRLVGGAFPRADRLRSRPQGGRAARVRRKPPVVPARGPDRRDRFDRA